MGRILAISSQVVRGHVGLSAIVPAVQRLGHDILPVPTIILSNHPGHPRAAGTRIEVNTLASIIEVLDANGWLAGLDTVITGYLPTPEHVGCVARAIDLIRARSSEASVLVDPVMGDDPRGLYVEQPVAEAIRDQLLPRASMITPNRFELSWLSGRDVRRIADVALAASALQRPLHVLATSVPAGDDRIANVSVDGADRPPLACVVPRLARVPHGTGDLLTGLYASRSGDRAARLGFAVAGVQQAIANSIGQSDLILSTHTPDRDWATVQPLPVGPAA